MIATTYMFHPQTITRLFSIPCVSVEVARMVALGQPHTLNIVVSAELVAAYRNKKMLFCTHSASVAHEWVRLISRHATKTKTTGATP